MLGVQLADVSTRCSSHPQGKIKCPQRIFVVSIQLLQLRTMHDHMVTVKVMHGGCNYFVVQA